MALTCIKRVKAAACAGLVALAPALAAAQSPGDADVLAAREAAQRGQWKVLDSYRARLAGHILEPYPAYWLLSGNVDRSDPREVQAFLARYPASPLAESLRREWLRALGAARSWELFRAEYPRMIGDDVEVACYSLQERLARDDSDAIAEAHALFVSSRETAAACDPVFAAALAARAITEPEAWERVRRLLAAGNVREAKRAGTLLPFRLSIADKTLDRVAADPGRFLAQERLGKNPNRASQETLLFAIERLARNKPDEAAERLAAMAPRLPAETVAYAWGQVGLQAALALNPRALEWYGHAGSTALTDSQIAWKARAALRAGDWKEVLASIQSLSPETARESNWRYWRARALRNLGSPDAADALLRGLAGQQTFYGLIAAEELGVSKAPDWSAWSVSEDDLARVRGLEGIQRSLALYRLGLDAEALREWQWAIRGLDDRSLLAAAQVAKLANEPERAINTADRTVLIHDLAQRFPTPHRDALAAAARQWDLDEAIVYGIVRQESRFMPEARSRVGATGLMQLMPATARWVARQIAMTPFRPEMLVRPDVNMQMGAYYFRRVLNELGHPILATAAYNAGPGRARRWRDERPLEGAVYVETIPFNETRDYVKKVFTNAWFYRHRLTGKAASMRELLGIVPGRAGEPAVASIIP
ncbi:MAG: transglycosylase SLT domain-containing protein [Usitatibacter sp.]